MYMQPTHTHDDNDCPEWCDHGGRCADARADIAAGERAAESAWERAAELPLLTEPLEGER